ncbi:MAG: helix-turn-helix domain-containing protein, partial [Eubacteriales bacterium]
MESEKKNPGQIIAALRRSKNLSQESLAEKLHVTRQAVSRWENGETMPNPETMRTLSVLFGVTIDTLFGMPVWEGIDGDSVFRSYTAKTEETHIKETDTMKENQKLRIGVFGGARGKTMISVLLHHPDAQLVAVCDKYVPLLEEAKQTAHDCGTEIAVFENFDDFIRYDMDAVVLANYANEHAVYAVRCLRAGKHVLSEVLPCETMAQAVELIETVEQTGLVYAYAENYCYMTHTFEMWRRYRTGELGMAMYGEGEYIHDCSAIWPRITYGERNHWRNRMFPTFYCTHSIGPLITITGMRPIRVVGFEMPLSKDMMGVGGAPSAGVEMVTLENGAVMKSVHGNLKREPGSINYELYCEKGMMETGRLSPLQPLNLYKEGERRCVGAWEQYAPQSDIAAEAAKHYNGHGGSDFYPTHFFIEKILGRPDGAWSIDVYTAVDMGICGILAYKSILAGNIPVDVPNLRNPGERDAWRTDNACCTPEIAGDQLL